MRVFDMHHGITVLRALSHAQYAAAITTGVIIDTAGYESLEFVALASAHAGDKTITLEHGDDSALADAAAVPATEVLGAMVIDGATAVKKLGYIGKKRYVRVTGVAAGDATFGVIAVLGTAHTQPTSD